MSKYALLIIVLLVPVGLSFAATPDQAICWSDTFTRDTNDQATGLNPCYQQLITKPFSVITAPFDVIAPGFGVLFIWAPIVFGLWFKTKSPAIAGIFGIVIVGTGLFTGNTSKTAIGVGITLLAVSTGISLIQIFQRIKQTV